MAYYEKAEDGVILYVIAGDCEGNISKERYDAILAAQETMPQRDGYGYRLREDLTWEEYELPPSEEPETYTEEALLGMTNAELTEILTGLGVSATMNKVNMVRLILLMQGEVSEE